MTFEIGGRLEDRGAVRREDLRRVVAVERTRRRSSTCPPRRAGSACGCHGRSRASRASTRTGGVPAPTRPVSHSAPPPWRQSCRPQWIQVGRSRDPHLGPTERRRRVRPMKRDKVRRRTSLGTAPRPCSRGRRSSRADRNGGSRSLRPVRSPPMGRDGDIGEVKPIAERRDPRDPRRQIPPSPSRAGTGRRSLPRPTGHRRQRTTRKCEMKVSRTRPSALPFTTRGSSTSISLLASQSIVGPSPGTHRGDAVKPGRRSRGRSATRTNSITSFPARIAPGLNTPTTSKSSCASASRSLGLKSNSSKCLFRIILTPFPIIRACHACASRSAAQATASESRPLSSVIFRGWEWSLDPGKLVGHHAAEQLAVTVRFVRSLTPRKVERLVDIEGLVPSLAGSILGPIAHGDVQPCSGENIASGRGCGPHWRSRGS